VFDCRWGEAAGFALVSTRLAVEAVVMVMAGVGSVAAMATVVGVAAVAAVATALLLRQIRQARVGQAMVAALIPIRSGTQACDRRNGHSNTHSSGFPSGTMALCST
jgi:hypothetical protein